MELNKIYNEDCLDTMARMEDGAIDLVVTSPPYDNLRAYTGEIEWTFDLFKKIAKELYRVVKEGGVVVWVVGDATVKGSETGTSFKQALYFKEIGFNLHDTMIYIKNGGLNSGSLKAYQQKFEYMFILVKGKIKTYNLIRDRKNKYVEDRVKYKKTSSGSVSEQHVKISEFGVRYNYWVYDTGYGKGCRDKISFKHPAVFPEKLAYDHIRSWSNEKDIVYDPFMGSGTTAVAAMMGNRFYIGSEISKEYCEVANRRVNSELQQLKF